MKRALARVPPALYLALAALALGIGGYFAFHAAFVKVGRSVEQPFAGPARHDPYYVLARFLEARGLRMQTARRWPQPLTDDTLVLWLSDDDLPADLRAWLATGGMLWTFRDPDRELPLGYAWQPTPWEDDASDDDVSAPLSADGVPPCDEGCLLSAQFRYGAGTLTLLHRHGIENEQVVRGPTPLRLDALLSQPRRPRRALLVTSVGSPWFGQLLLAHAPMALWGSAVLLALALWRAASHFGPRAELRVTARREMLEHVAAVGSLAARTGLAPLLAAARRPLRQALTRRVPQAQSLTDEALIAALAQATALPPAALRRALFDAPRGGKDDVLAIARAVQALWRKT